VPVQRQAIAGEARGELGNPPPPSMRGASRVKAEDDGWDPVAWVTGKRLAG
jgi:hypothetical protein